MIKKIQKKIKPIYQFYILLLLLPVFQSFSSQKNNVNEQVEKYPIEVSVKLRINKIYNINSVDETYQIDGYLIYSWHDEDVKFKTKNGLVASKTYQKERINELKNKMWIPTFELINIQGSGDTPNIRIDVYSNGKINYEKRFFETFSSKMDFIKFPFDTQSYLISIEAFGSNSNELVFKDPKFFVEGEANHYIAEDWEFISKKTSIIKKKYQFMHDDIDSDKNLYSRVTFEVTAKRLPGYYQWQVLFPLLIIILASFAIFWIEDFGTQIGVGFTLMLTVVAFNFYSASILPKLTYNTFIEYVIIVGYIFIFLGIIAVIINNRVNRGKKKKAKVPLLIYFRYLFPLFYGLVMLILYMKLIR